MADKEMDISRQEEDTLFSPIHVPLTTQTHFLPLWLIALIHDNEFICVPAMPPGLM